MTPVNRRFTLRFVPTVPEVIGARIRHRRLELGLTLTDLADKVGVSRQAIHAWETGDSTPHLDRQTLVAEVLDLPWAALFSPEEGK